MLLPLLPTFLDPATRLDAYLKAHPSFVASFSAEVGGKPIATGTLRIARPDRMRFDVKGQGFDYTAVSTPTALIDLDRIEKVYDEHPPIGRMRMYDSRISGAPALMPRFLMASSTEGLFGTKPTASGDDELRATIQSEMGPINLRLLVDAQGRPTLFSSKGPGGLRQWKIGAIYASPANSPFFRVEAPLGYVPHAVPDLPNPLPIGEVAPLTGWQKAGRPLDLAQPAGARLLAVLGEDCPASRAVRPFLKGLAGTMPVFIIGKGEITDPSGNLMKRLSPPGTPMFYLVGSDGKVKKLWFGFDSAKGAAWQAEVREAAK